MSSRGGVGIGSSEARHRQRGDALGRAGSLGAVGSKHAATPLIKMSAMMAAAAIAAGLVVTGGPAADVEVSGPAGDQHRSGTATLAHSETFALAAVEASIGRVDVSVPTPLPLSASGAEAVPVPGGTVDAVGAGPGLSAGSAAVVNDWPASLRVVGPSFFAPVLAGIADPVTGRSRSVATASPHALVPIAVPVGPFAGGGAFLGLIGPGGLLIGDGLDGAPGQAGANGADGDRGTNGSFSHPNATAGGK